jgi:CelD/BcsL family acetyltransferase involved in cellulose biosynthesis
MPQSLPVQLDVHAPAVLAAASAPRPAGRATEGLGSSVRFKVYDELPAVEAVWRYVEASADCTIFQTYDWVACWHRHIGSLERLNPAVVLVYQGDRVLMVLPLAVQRRGPLRHLIWLGGEFCDYGAPLLAGGFAGLVTPERFRLIWRQVAEFLQQDRRFRHDVVELQKMPETIGRQPNPLCWLDVQLNPSGAYLTQLSGSWEEFYAGKRSSATRRRDRTKRKRLAEHGEIRLLSADDGDQISRTLNTLFEQKTRSFARMGVRNIFKPAGHRDFLLDFATGPRSHSLAHVSRLEVGGTTVAANLGLVYRGRYYHLLASHDDGETSRFGPGIVHLHGLLQHAIDTGCREFDFTIGDERYKQDWCDTEIKLYDHIASATILGWPVATAALSVRRVKRVIKQTPLLWNLVTKARAVLGGGGKPKSANEAVD